MKRLASNLLKQSVPVAKRTRHHLSITKFVSASSTYNYVKNDHLSDWLKRGEERKYNNPFSEKQPPKKFVDFIKQRGNEFETSIVNSLKERFDVKYGGNIINEFTCKNTKDFINDRAEIIYSAPFQDKTTKTQGIIDLLVRSDILNKMISTPPPQLCSSITHYVVFDIKFSTVPLAHDGIHILNQGHYHAYKHQLCIYNNALQSLQNYIPRYAYILGRRCKSTVTKNKITQTISTSSPFEKVGTIDYRGHDSNIVHSTDNSIEWVRRVETDGHKWSVSPPSIKELYPNMRIDSGKLNKRKREIADDIGEITDIWMCGVNARTNALKNNIFSWRDPKCNADILGFKNKQAIVVDAILNINRGEPLGSPISRTFSQQENIKFQGQCEMFIDFETFVDVNLRNDIDGTSFGAAPIFMVGIVVHKKNRNAFEKISYTFTVDNMSPEEEKRILTETYQLFKKYKPSKVFYWYAEKNIWNKRCEELELQFDINPNWFDLLKVFKDEPIVIKGAFNFGLKQISTAMYNNNLVKYKLESECQNGLIAAVNAQKEFEKGLTIETSQILKDIKQYNDFDVKILLEIITYLRNMK